MSKCNDACKYYKHCWSRGEGLKEDGEECMNYEPERPHGEWIRLDKYESVWRCSVCKEASCCKANFCPDCGADMRKEGEAE